MSSHRSQPSSAASTPAPASVRGAAAAPRSITELAKVAQGYAYDGSRSLKDILVGASALKKEGDRLAQEGDLENAFINYARAATIVVDRVPTHVSYHDLSTVHRHNLKLNGNDIMQRLGDLKPQLSDRFEKYQAQLKQQQQTSESSAASNERIRAAREAQAREYADKQGQRQAAKRQAEENAAAVRRHQEQEQRRLQEEARKRAAAEEDRKRREAVAAQAAEDERRRQEAERWNFNQLQASLASTSAAAAQQQQRKGSKIEYQPPVRDEDEYFMPRAHPVESPLSEYDDSSSDYGGPSHHPAHQPQPLRPPPGRGNPIEPITTTSPITDVIHYPKLMSPHQRTQGYAPSLQSMFVAPAHPEAVGPNGALGLSGLYSFPLPTASQPFNFSNVKQPFTVQSRMSQYAYANPRAPMPGQGPAPVPQPPPRPPKQIAYEPPVVKASELPPAAVRSPELKGVVFPREVLPRFVSIAAYNTSKNLETCGLLMGRLKKNGKAYVVTTLLIPQQRATSDTCAMEEEELLVDFQSQRDLIILGWIHTHPTQSCFMSSVDLHTHSGYQSMLPEAFAVVCAPKSKPNFGIFRLTDPPGIQTIMACSAKDAFHPHPPDIPIYTDADKGHVQMQDNLQLEIADLRTHTY
ncbi:hypothetical protein EXIGLDRAFT_833964 [Exidia glandulosa HHB12029]|uniref:MPN domain-containing protein n=1 Tax=Exidia glandulosa HHB12029 TaxID=1314781 RepID=A0A165KAC9_EXIGL|nr:hypothetical protein EXIGLDRAFT_833964 [Exidia glandulosa HHB12029]